MTVAEPSKIFSFGITALRLLQFERSYQVTDRGNLKVHGPIDSMLSAGSDLQVHGPIYKYTVLSKNARSYL